jgi:hypothetical protein
MVTWTIFTDPILHWLYAHSQYYSIYCIETIYTHTHTHTRHWHYTNPHTFTYTHKHIPTTQTHTRAYRHNTNTFKHTHTHFYTHNLLLLLSSLFYSYYYLSWCLVTLPCLHVHTVSTSNTSYLCTLIWYWYSLFIAPFLCILFLLSYF